MAGLCPLEVYAVDSGGARLLLEQQEALISDGPALVAPGTLKSSELATVGGFELRLKKTERGQVSFLAASSAFPGDAATIAAPALPPPASASCRRRTARRRAASSLSVWAAFTRFLQSSGRATGQSRLSFFRRQRKRRPGRPPD